MVRPTHFIPEPAVTVMRLHVAMRGAGSGLEGNVC
jgi:hypothetical protein